VLVRGCTGADLQACTQTLFALDLATGAILARTELAGAVTSASGATVTFDPNHHWGRTGLLLAGGSVLAAFAGGPLGDQHEEDFVYHGWVFKVSTADAKVADVYCTTPDGQGGGVWQGGGGLTAVDGTLYFATGNGIQIPVPAAPGGFPARPANAENSLVSLPVDAPWAGAARAFYDDRPYAADGDVFQYLEKNDIDFSASGPAALPGAGALVVGAKSGMLYLLDAPTLTLLQPPLNAFTNLALPSGQTLYIYSYVAPAILDSPVVWRADADGARYAYVYAWALQDWLKAFRYDYQTRTLTPLATATGGTPTPSGGALSVTADGGQARTALVWSLTARLDGSTGAQISAFDAETLTLLWQAPLPARSKFVPPTIAGGKVFVPSTSPTAGTTQELFVFGL
jgi:outer membrane protein assembly factor BamB